MLPLAVAGPILVVPLDRAGPRRLISFLAAVVRATIAFSVAGTPRHRRDLPGGLGDPRGRPRARHHEERAHDGVRRSRGGADAIERPARPGGGGGRADRRAVRYRGRRASGARAARWSSPASSTRPARWSRCGCPIPGSRTEPKPIGRRGRIPVLTGPAIGAAGMRAATGFILFLSAFAVRREGFPSSWFAAMAIAAAAGGFLADLLAPKLPETLREEFIVVGCTVAAGLGAFLAFQAFSLPVLVALRAHGRRRDGARPARVPEPDAGQRAGRCARSGLRALRGDVPALVGRGGAGSGGALDRLQGRDPDGGGVLPGARGARGPSGSTAAAGSRSEHRRTCRRLARCSAIRRRERRLTWRSS